MTVEELIEDKVEEKESPDHPPKLEHKKTLDALLNQFEGDLEVERFDSSNNKLEVPFVIDLLRKKSSLLID